MAAYKRNPVDKAIETLVPDYEYDELESLKGLSQSEKLDMLYALGIHLLEDEVSSSLYCIAYLKSIKALNFLIHLYQSGELPLQHNVVEYLIHTACECEETICNTELPPIEVLEWYREKEGDLDVN